MNMSPQEAQKALDILLARKGEWSLVVLNSGKEIRVLNCVYGLDMGADFAHVTTNINPSPGQASPVDFFHTDELVKISDAASGRRLWAVGNDG